MRSGKTESNVASLQNCIDRICSIRVSRIGGEYAPHKPLFLIYLLGLIYNKHDNLFAYREIEQPLSNLIRDFGSRNPAQPHYPFWHLANDGFWILSSRKSDLRETIGVGPSAAKMRDIEIKGRFEYRMYKRIQENANVSFEVIQKLFTQYMPHYNKMEVLSAVGLVDLYSEQSHRLRANQEANSIIISNLTNLLGTNNSQRNKKELSSKKAYKKIKRKCQIKSDEQVKHAKNDAKSNDSFNIINKSDIGIDLAQSMNPEIMDKLNYSFDNVEGLIVAALDSLPEREKELIVLSEALLPGSKAITYAEIARSHGISRERIRQLSKRAMNSIKSYASWNGIWGLIAGAMPQVLAEHRCMNLYDFYCCINERLHFGTYDPLACCKLILSLAGKKTVFKKNILNTECFSGSSLAPPRVVVDSFELIELFYGINQYEIEYLEERYKMFKDAQKIITFSINSSVWSKLSGKEIFAYLEASVLFPAVYSKYKAIIDAVIDSGGAVANSEAIDMTEKLYNTHGINSEGILRLLSDMLGGLKYDANHYLWVAEGYSWRDNKKYKFDDYSNLPADGKKMSQTNAAHRILLEYQEPVTFTEIMRIAIRRGYIKTKAKNPAGGLRSLIYNEQEMDKQLGRESRFETLEGGYLALTGRGQKLFEGDNRHRRTTKGRTPYAEIAYEVLKENGGAMHYKEIAEKMQIRSEALNSNSTPESIQRALKREEKQDDSRFIEIENGVWALSYFAHVGKKGTANSVVEEHGNRSAQKSNKASDHEKSKFLDFLGLISEE